MRRIAIAGLLLLTALIGCARLKPTSSGAAPSSAPVVVPQATETAPNAAPQPAGSPERPVPPTPKVQPPSATLPARADPALNSVAAVEPPDVAATQSDVKAVGPSATGAKTSSPSRPVKPSAPAGGTAPLSRQAIVPTAPGKPPTPTLNLASLEQRLRDTNSIGVFTKLSLKNQVDDLLNQFRAFYRGQSKASLDQLRQRYDLLLLKVLTLLQDGDPSLAAAISSSREAIWGILTDPAEFAKI
jgi:hypothetical protein